jgi:hypothetical protein
MSPVTRLEKLLFGATLGVIPFMAVIGTFIHGVVLEGVCFLEPPGGISHLLNCYKRNITHCDLWLVWGADDRALHYNVGH